MGITFYTHDCKALSGQGAEVELTGTQKLVLLATRSFKSSYRAERLYNLISNYRSKLNDDDKKEYFAVMTETGYEQVRQELIALGLMTKNKALNVKGKNVAATLGSFDDYFRQQYGSWL